MGSRFGAWQMATMAAVLLLVASPVTQAGEEIPQKAFEIEAQPLETALSVFAKQADLQILFTPDSVAGIQSKSISGTLPVLRALERLLQGTGLHYEFIDQHTIAVSRIKSATSGVYDVEHSRVVQHGNATGVRGRSNENATDGTALEEVIVTAQRREENLQDVPISITAISAKQLEDRKIEGITGLNSVVPTLMYKPQPGSDLISQIGLRGSSSGNPGIFMDPPVGLYVDGVYISKAQGSVFDVIDIERIEVMRGPQGTLFGRNTEGGAINIVTRKPAGVWRGTVSLDFGNLDHSIERAVLDLPRMGIASVGIGYRKERQKGWATNLTGPDLGKKEKEAFRVAGQIDVSDDFVVNVTWDRSDANSTPPPTNLFATNGSSGNLSMLGLGPTVSAPWIATSRTNTVATNTPAGQSIYEKLTTDGRTLQIAYRWGDQNSLKYVYAAREFEYDDANDIDGMNLAARNYYYQRHTDYEQISHEVQWIGEVGPINYVAGYYYFKDDGTTLGPQDASIFFLPTVRSDYSVNTAAHAVYGQLDYALTKKLTVTAGFRYTEEEKGGWSHKFRTTGFDGPFLTDTAPGTLPMTSYSAKFSGNTPMLALSYKHDEWTNLYARLARGFKSGGFSGDLGTPAVRIPVRPQFSLSAEVGIKKTFLENRARINAAVFHERITDQQVTQLIPGTAQSFLANAAKSTYQGLELEASVIPLDGWNNQAAYGYVQRRFDEYMNAARNIPGNPVIDVSGSTEVGAPMQSFNIVVDGRLARTSYGKLGLILDFSYSRGTGHAGIGVKDLSAPDAPIIGQLAVLNQRPDYFNTNVRLLLSGIPLSSSGSGEVSLWAQNVTDEDRQLGGIDFGFFRTANWQVPRTYGIGLSYRW